MKHKSANMFGTSSITTNEQSKSNYGKTKLTFLGVDVNWRRDPKESRGKDSNVCFLRLFISGFPVHKSNNKKFKAS